MSPLIGAHQLGWDGDLIVTIGEPNSTALVAVRINEQVEWLERRDVERLRELCDEALA